MSFLYTGYYGTLAGWSRTIGELAPAVGTREELALLGVGRVRAGQPGEARRELLVVLAARHPDDAEVAYQAAWVHDVLGLEAEAVASTSGPWRVTG